LSNGLQVSVVVPARNEEASLGECLQSLVSQEGVNAEVIVVDDGSTDRTREIAQSFPGVRVLSPGRLPEGWSGKVNAVICGAAEARGEWLLFTDADTVHLPGSLARSIAETRRHDAELLSYSPEQDVRGLWEKAVMPVIFAELAQTYPPSEVNNPASPVAAANGQYILISRAAYESVGGFASVATTLLEDVALARAVKGSGRRVFFRFGGDAVRTRMYRSFAQLREGWTKNLALLFHSPMRLALIRLAEFVLIAGSAEASILAWFLGRPFFAVGTGILFLTTCANFVGRIRRAHFGAQATSLALLGLPLFSYLLMGSWWAHKRGNVAWKGRRYAGSALNRAAMPAATVVPAEGSRNPAARNCI